MLPFFLRNWKLTELCDRAILFFNLSKTNQLKQRQRRPEGEKRTGLPISQAVNERERKRRAEGAEGHCQSGCSTLKRVAYAAGFH